MPAFPGAAGSTNIVPALCSLGPGDSAYVFGAPPAGQGSANAIDDTNVIGEEMVPAAGFPEASASVAFSIKGGGTPPMVCIEVGFVTAAGVPAAPGTFEIDVQEADTNNDISFTTPAAAAYTITAVNASTQKARVDLWPTGGKFMRLYVRNLTNDVDLIAKITRLA